MDGQTKGGDDSDDAARRRTRGIGVASIVPLLVLCAAFARGVPLGTPGYLVYRYSPLVTIRLSHVVPALLLGAVAVWVLHRGTRDDGRIARWTWAPAAACWIGLVAWTFVAPPLYVSQVLFNLESPSHDGAFVREARGVTSIRDYLARDFYTRIALPPDQLQGTRVISNPPGVTVLAVAVRRWVDGAPRLRAWMDRAFDLTESPWPLHRRIMAQQLILAMIFTALWGGAIGVGYRLGRLAMPPLPALTVALAVTFNPATVNFTPGKDPAQVLTVLLLMQTGLAAYLHRRRTPAVLCGVVFALSLMVGLVHVWVVAILVTGTLWHAVRRGDGVAAWLVRCLIPAACGFLAAGLVAWLVLDWNLARSTLAVARRYPQIQRHLINGAWTLVGLPMFLLFAGPTFWCLITVLRPRRRRDADSVTALGHVLCACCLVVMAVTYVFANNNETPRLWIPFLAVLTVALALGQPVFRTASARHRRTCLMLIALQIGVTALHWSFMDVRESETRLLPGPDGSPPRMWD